ncbi:MAG TPA: fimbria/pilus periplasmic chaperone [Myxococcales bacterium]|nr:fimbria/pilus periplasmic chaperone [Myxococcales bacterium]
MQTARAALIAVALTASSARAGGLNVSPIQLLLSPQTTKAMLTLRNDGVETVRYQVSATSWNQNSKGELQLAPTNEVLFFPALFTLKPGEERNVRVGVGTPFGLVEKTYRVFVEELPPTARPAQPSSEVRVLTRVGVPVFLAPARAVERRTIEGLGARGGRASFRVSNQGTLHFREDAVKLRGLDAKGEVLFEREQRGWYVLAGGALDYEFELPKGCQGLAALLASVTADNGDRFEQRAPAEPSACAP